MENLILCSNWISHCWVVSIVEVDLLKHCRIKTLHFFLLWVFGFFLLLSFDLFMEGIVFEWLEWNGTTKNDWFFVLWWGVVVVWFLCGIITLYQRLKKWEKLLHSKTNLLRRSILLCYSRVVYSSYSVSVYLRKFQRHLIYLQIRLNNLQVAIY